MIRRKCKGVLSNLSINFYQSSWYYGNCSTKDDEPLYEVVEIGEKGKMGKRTDKGWEREGKSSLSLIQIHA